MRWRSPDDASVAGYHLHVREDGGSYGTPIDVRPSAAADPGQFEALLDDLAVETTYTFALSAYTADGRESGRSNEQTIGYAQAAAVVDSDHDGLVDAEEDVNLNRQRDPGETDRLVADTDGDQVPDGLELEHGSDPLDAVSPACTSLDFATWSKGASGSAQVLYDPDAAADVLVTTSSARNPLRVRVTYAPAAGTVLDAPVLATAIRDGGPFRVELMVRSAAGHRYRLRYDGNGGKDSAHGRRLTVALGTSYGADAYAPLARDVAADLARLDPTAVFAGIERMRISGVFALRQVQTCH